jgi:cation transport ATPase
MMKKMIVLICCILTSPSLLAATSIKAEVNGMVCAFCAKGIEKKLNAMPEAKDAFVNLKRRIVVLELKENQDVPIASFTKVIEEAGYSVSKVEKVDQSIQMIKDAMKVEK